MIRKFAILFTALFAFALPVSAAEMSIAVVDFQAALDQVTEGKTTRARLEGMFAERQKAIGEMENQLRDMKEQYDKQAMILSDAARAQKEQEMMQAQGVYQQTYMQAEQEMQAAYGQSMEALISKMRVITEEIGKEKGYTLVLETTESGIVYSAGTNDVTSELIKRYNAKHGG